MIIVINFFVMKMRITRGMSTSVIIAFIAGALVLVSVVYYNLQPKGEIMKEMGEDMAEEGEAMMEKGKDMMEEGEVMIEKGESMMEKNKAMTEEGESMMEGGEAITE
ncbi:MAG: hypothetical protein IID36_03450 [Planctomycetes bacterium]|nr:hypothetical protein [Planctomycetota bacterium]